MSDSTITCPRCGSTMPEGGRFCMNCGHIMESPVEQSATETEATEPGMPGESMEMSTDANASDGGAAIVSGSIGSTQAESVPEESFSPSDDVAAQPHSEMPLEEASTPPESWYASLASSPGDTSSPPGETGTSANEPSLETGPQSDSEPQSMAEAAPASQPADEAQTIPVYSHPSSSQWQPGAYDMSATQPVDIPVSNQAPSEPSGPATGQPQSIFAPPPPPPAASQGQYTQPTPSQQGYSPPTYAPQQTFTPPPGYSNQALPPAGTQPLQPGQSYPNYQQYPPGYPVPQQAVAPKDPTTALMLELLGYLGFLGIGHIYAGKTNRGIGLLIGWLVYLTAAFFLTICLVGCFMFLAWVVVPPLSGLWVKNEMEKERITGIRQ